MCASFLPVSTPSRAGNLIGEARNRGQRARGRVRLWAEHQTSTSNTLSSDRPGGICPAGGVDTTHPQRRCGSRTRPPAVAALRRTCPGDRGAAEAVHGGISARSARRPARVAQLRFAFFGTGSSTCAASTSRALQPYSRFTLELRRLSALSGSSWSRAFAPGSTQRAQGPVETRRSTRASARRTTCAGTP